LVSSGKSWHLLPHDPKAIAALGERLRVAPIVAQVLINRGLGEAAAARHFLDSPLVDLHKPDLLPGAVEAAERIHAAVRQGRRVCIYGDYDVDGITGTAILWQLLQRMGAPVDYYVPHRLDEGYGLNARALRQIAGKGASLVVTVDCGITAIAEAEEARRLGLELLITDHHEFKAELPAAAVLVHPRLPGGAYPFGSISGAGVAFKVAWALCQLICGSDKVTPGYREFLLDSVALASLGLVADVVPLRGENRIFVRHGLARLAHTTSPGLRALLESSGLSDKTPLLADDVSYRLAPRINAAGRIGSAWLVVELLTTASADRAAELARHLEANNVQRQQIERRILSQAREQLAADGADFPAVVLDSRDWHPGVIGIVAGRLADQYARPALLIAVTEPSPPLWQTTGGGSNGPESSRTPPLQSSESETEGAAIGHGSGRSVPGVPLHEVLQECSDLLLGHGGHAAAAGFRIRPERIEPFRTRFCEAVQRRFPSGLPEPRLVIDAEIPLSALTFDFLRDLARLEPYGSDNPRPLFLAGGLQVVGNPAKVGGGERHLSFRVRQHGTSLRAVAFGMADRLDELMSAGGQCCLVFTPRINEWQGFRRIEIEAIDFQPGPRAQLQ
jgi:single-stranded-DNA-specific exonuclease